MGFPPTMNIKNVASFIAAAYGVNVGHPNQLAPIEAITRQTLDEAYDAVNDFRGPCGGQLNLVINFLRALDQGQATAKLLALRQINQAFGCQASVLPNNPPLARWTAFGAECAHVPAPAQPHLNSFYRSRNPGTALRDIEIIFNTANNAGQGAECLAVMAAVMEHHGDPSGITSMAIIALVRMLAAQPPTSVFNGFTQWGPGDNANPVANLDAHVLKHICRQPVDVNFGVSETMAWWAALNVSLTLTDYDQLAANPQLHVRTSFDGLNPLSGDRLKRFLVYQGLLNEPALTQFIKNQAIVPYRDFAIQQSQAMTNIIVHSNGTRVFISGRAGEAFIIGRFEGAQLGISSCYRPLNMQEKLDGARANMCWPLQ